MKKLPQTIESCHQCPYYRQERDFTRMLHICVYDRPHSLIMDTGRVPVNEQQTRLDEIPDWCPLEDA